MTTRRRFTGEFKARVALEALRGDKTVQEIAARRKVPPNQVSTYKRRSNKPSLKQPSPTQTRPLLNHRHQLPVAHLPHTLRSSRRHHRMALQRLAPAAI